MSETERVPNPGSNEAREQGCTCPVWDNHKGEGRPLPDGTHEFIYNRNCTLHGQGPEDTDELRQQD